MTGAGRAALAALLVTACASEPAFAPPTEDEARAAYIRAIRADLIDTPAQRTPAESSAIIPGDTPAEAGRKAGGVLSSEAERNDRAMAQRNIESLGRITLGECEWAAIDPDDIRPYGRERVEGVAQGYRCEYEVFHNTEQRGLVSARGTGYFFHRDGSYDFGQIEQATFERAARDSAR